jgi:hypothetical protein
MKVILNYLPLLRQRVYYYSPPLVTKKNKVFPTLTQGQNRFWNRYLNWFRNRNPRSQNNLLPNRRNRKRRRRSGRKLKNRSSRSASKVKNRFPTDFPAILPPTGSNRFSRRSRGTRRSRSSLRRSSGERVRAKIQVRFPPFHFSLAGFEPSNLGSRGSEALSPSKQLGCQYKSADNFIKYNLIVFTFSKMWMSTNF